MTVLFSGLITRSVMATLGSRVVNPAILKLFFPGKAPRFLAQPIMSAKNPYQGDGERKPIRYPRKMGSLVNQLIARRGYAQVQAADQLREAVDAAVGKELAKTVRAGNLRRGVLELYASDSVTLQELTFMKRRILKKLIAVMPQCGIKDIRFRIRS